MEFEEDRAPQVIGMKNLMLAFCLHVAVFLIFWIFSIVNFKPKEMIVPIELVFEAPPDEITPDEVKPPEPPKPVVKQPDPVPEVDEKLDAVVKIKDKKKKPEKKKPEPPKEKPKPPEPEKPKEPPKPVKTKEQIKREKKEAHRKKIEQMQKSATYKKGEKTPVAGTGTKLDPNWKKLLAQGYKPSDHTELAANEESRCISLIYAALERQWDELNPKVGKSGIVVLRVGLTRSGRIVDCRIVKSCGDTLSDMAALTVARTTGVVMGLSQEFISKNPTVLINYTVKTK